MKCAVCSEEKNTRLCSGCLSTAYCSTSCQKKDWASNHKRKCLPYKIVRVGNDSSDSIHNISQYSTYFVATRDLSQGTKIYDEMPLCQVPDFNCHHDEEEESIFWYDRKTTYCLICGMRMGGYNRRPLHSCSSCGFPVCPECEKIPIHSENECLVFSKEGIKYEGICKKDDETHPCIVRKIMKIRLDNLKKNQPNTWSEMMTLYDSSSSHFIKHDDDDDVQKVFDLMKKRGFFRCSNIDFSQQHDFNKSPFNYGSLLYQKSSNLIQACKPNCTFTIGPYPEFPIRIRAAVPIKAGEKLTVNHLKTTSILPGTHERRRLILDKFGFICKCQLCVDPTEAGTYMSAIACTICNGDEKCKKDSPKFEGDYSIEDLSNSGYLLPEDPTQYGGDASWKCSKCSKVVLFSSLEPLLRDVQIKSQQLLCRDSLKENFSRGNIEKPFKDMIKKICATQFHPNHWIIQAINFNLIDMVYTLKQAIFTLTLKDPDLDEMIRRSKYLMKIHDMIYPGLSPSAVHMNNLIATVIFYVFSPIESVFRSLRGIEDARKYAEYVKLANEYQTRVYNDRKTDIPVNGKSKSEWDEDLSTALLRIRCLGNFIPLVKETLHYDL